MRAESPYDAPGRARGMADMSEHGGFVLAVIALAAVPSQIEAVVSCLVS